MHPVPKKRKQIGLHSATITSMPKSMPLIRTAVAYRLLILSQDFLLSGNKAISSKINSRFNAAQSAVLKWAPLLCNTT